MLSAEHVAAPFLAAEMALVLSVATAGIGGTAAVFRP